MYLSRVEVDYTNRQKTKDLTHLGAFHNWVEQSFPDEIEAGVRERHLWRLDTIANRQFLLVLSNKEPDGDQLSRYAVNNSFLSKEYEQVLDNIHQGQTLRFRLTANPTHAVNEGSGKRGKVYPHVTVEQQRNWLLNRAAKLGFSIPSALTDDDEMKPAFDVVSRDYPVLHHGRRKMRLSRVSFEGLLKIEDLELFKQTLITGVGREKAYGMGLLTVIPVG